jgi:Terminase RNaseH-like domain
MIATTRPCSGAVMRPDLGLAFASLGERAFKGFGDTGVKCASRGIIVAGKDKDSRGYVLADLSGHYTPIEWAKVAVAAYKAHGADRIVAEVNNGGDMVEATLRVVDDNVAYTAVHATRGKVVRAEPVLALYEQGRIRHMGSFPQLEDQMCEFTPDMDRSKPKRDPSDPSKPWHGRQPHLARPRRRAGVGLHRTPRLGGRELGHLLGHPAQRRGTDKGARGGARTRSPHAHLGARIAGIPGAASRVEARRGIAHGRKQYVRHPPADLCRAQQRVLPGRRQ